MFFVVSKLYEAFFSPIPLLLLLALAGATFSCGRAARLGRALAIGSTLALLVIAMTPVGLMLVAPIEDRFPPPPADAPPPYGLIILGGAIKSDESEARGQAVFDEGERVVQAAILARRYPEARIVFSGGNGSLWGHLAGKEAQEVKKLLIALGVDRCPRDAGGPIPQHRRERALHRGFAQPPAWSTVAAGHVGVSHAPLDGSVREGRLQRRRLSGSLPNDRPRLSVPVVPGRYAKPAHVRDRREGMGRSAGLLGEGPDRPAIPWTARP